VKVHDFFIGAFFLIIGSGICLYASQLPVPHHVKYGPGVFPAIIGTGMILVGAAIAFKSLSVAKGGKWLERPSWLESPKAAIRFWIIPASIPFYMLVADSFGFVLTSMVIMSSMLWVRGVSPLRAIITGVAVSLVLTVLFASILKVPLPWGPLTGISGHLLW